MRADDTNVHTDESGRVADRSIFEHTARFARRLYTVADGVWCLVGNGLSNQSFVRGPDGIIAIDTGESVEEMRSALAELRHVTDAPIVAVLYTHFHYVGGTTAITGAEPAPGDGPIRDVQKSVAFIQTVQNELDTALAS